MCDSFRVVLLGSSVGGALESGIRREPPSACGFSAVRVRPGPARLRFAWMATARETARLRTLLETGIAISSELSLDAVLERIVEAAASLTGARYAALGVIDRTGTALERFVTTGIDEETRATIGDLPRGRGILGVLISEAQPLRLHDLQQDPRSVGFPPGHPPMHTFLGVPILLRGVAYGNLYLTEKDERRRLHRRGRGARHAARGAGRGRDRERAALRVGDRVVAAARVAERGRQRARSPSSTCRGCSTSSSTRLRELIDARLVAIALPAGERPADRGGGGRGARASIVGLTLAARASKAGRVLERRRSERVDSMLDDPEVDQDDDAAARRDERALRAAARARRGDRRRRSRTTSSAPTRASATPTCASPSSSPTRAAVAVDLSRAGRARRAAARRRRPGARAPAARARAPRRDRPGADLDPARPEDGRGGADGRADARRRATSCASSSSRRCRTSAGSRSSCGRRRSTTSASSPALERLTQTFAEATGIEVDLEPALGDERLPGEVETALYRIVQEALTNVVKHAGARKVSILLDAQRRQRDRGDRGRRQRASTPRPCSEDGLGLLGMRERVALLDGRLPVESAPGCGTTLVAEVPLRDPRPDRRRPRGRPRRAAAPARRARTTSRSSARRATRATRSSTCARCKPDVVLLDVVMPGRERDRGAAEAAARSRRRRRCSCSRCRTTRATSARRSPPARAATC